MQTGLPVLNQTSILNLKARSKPADNQEPTDDELDQVVIWVLSKLKALFGGKIYEGNTKQQALEVRRLWRHLVKSIGKKGIIETYAYIEAGHAEVSCFAPSVIEFRRIHHIREAAKIRFKSTFVPPPKIDEKDYLKGAREIKKIKMILARSSVCGKPRYSILRTVSHEQNNNDEDLAI